MSVGNFASFSFLINFVIQKSFLSTKLNSIVCDYVLMEETVVIDLKLICFRNMATWLRPDSSRKNSSRAYCLFLKNKRQIWMFMWWLNRPIVNNSFTPNIINYSKKVTFMKAFNNLSQTYCLWSPFHYNYMLTIVSFIFFIM